MRPSGTPHELEQCRIRAVRLLSEGFSPVGWRAKLALIGAVSVAGKQPLAKAERTPWRPRRYEFLWAGAGYRLRVFSDVWNLAHGTAFPGIAVEETQDEARREVLAVTGR